MISVALFKQCDDWTRNTRLTRSQKETGQGKESEISGRISTILTYIYMLYIKSSISRTKETNPVAHEIEYSSISPNTHCSILQTDRTNVTKHELRSPRSIQGTRL